MDYAPPPFFRRGPAPLARLAFFASLSIALLVLDARFRYVDGLRSALALAAYPLQQIALAPIVLADAAARYASSLSTLQRENEALRAQLVTATRNAQRFEAAEAEVGQLRALVGATPRQSAEPIFAEILYLGRDPYSHKVIIGRGTTHGVTPGSPVVDDHGVVGQVTRAHALASEVTLATDRDNAIPVQIVRNGLRAIAFGSGASGRIELRYMAASADIEDGDRLVTSGIDGTYPAGIPVGTVVSIERDSAQGFARIVCEPAGGVERGRYVLVLPNTAPLPAYPAAEAAPGDRRGDKSRRTPRK